MTTGNRTRRGTAIKTPVLDGWAADGRAVGLVASARICKAEELVGTLEISRHLIKIRTEVNVCCKYSS